MQTSRDMFVFLCSLLPRAPLLATVPLAFDEAKNDFVRVISGLLASLDMHVHSERARAVDLELNRAHTSARACAAPAKVLEPARSHHFRVFSSTKTSMQHILPLKTKLGILSSLHLQSERSTKPP